MEKTNGLITTEENITSTQDFLFTYDENEKQEIEINTSNAKLVFSPKFIPVYPVLLEKGLTIIEALVFGFIDFYTSNASARFYFTNDQIANMLYISRASITNAISKLEKMEFIKTSRRIRSGGGQIRFVIPNSQNSVFQLLKPSSLTTKKPLTNYNKINENKIKRDEGVKKLTPYSSQEFLKKIPLEDIRELQENAAITATEEQIRAKGLELNDYCIAKGRRYKNYKAFLRNALRKDYPKKKGFIEKFSFHGQSF